MVIDFNGCKGMDSVSLEYKTDCPRSIYFPKALIPNGDSLNDQFARVVYGIIINLKFITGGERLYFTVILLTRDGMVTTREYYNPMPRLLGSAATSSREWQFKEKADL
jgi:hypothetical protein